MLGPYIFYLAAEGCVRKGNAYSTLRGRAKLWTQREELSDEVPHEGLKHSSSGEEVFVPLEEEEFSESSRRGVGVL